LVLLARVDTVVADDVGGGRAAERAKLTEEATAVARGADRVQIRWEAQEHQVEKFVWHDVNLVRRSAHLRIIREVLHRE
jgi:hypothetical protein